MRKTLLQIEILYNDLGRGEQRIADWILKNPTGLIPLSITQLANLVGCGEATVYRFAKRLGFEGYQELKISLAKEENDGIPQGNINENDSMKNIFHKVSDDIYRSLEKTEKTVSYRSLTDAAERIMQSRLILVFGLGNSASVATDTAHKLLRIGLNAVAFSDNHMQAIAAAHLSGADTVIGVSHSGSSVDIVEAMKIAKSKGAFTIAITDCGRSPIDKYSDLKLATAADETNYSILALNSRIAQLAIIDALYFYIIYRMPNAKNAIEETERALLNKKY